MESEWGRLLAWERWGFPVLPTASLSGLLCQPPESSVGSQQSRSRGAQQGLGLVPAGSEVRAALPPPPTLFPNCRNRNTIADGF